MVEKLEVKNANFSENLDLFEYSTRTTGAGYHDTKAQQRSLSESGDNSRTVRMRIKDWEANALVVARSASEGDKDMSKGILESRDCSRGVEASKDIIEEIIHAVTSVPQSVFLLPSEEPNSIQNAKPKEDITDLGEQQAPSKSDTRDDADRRIFSSRISRSYLRGEYVGRSLSEGRDPRQYARVKAKYEGEDAEKVALPERSFVQERTSSDYNIYEVKTGRENEKQAVSVTCVSKSEVTTDNIQIYSKEDSDKEYTGKEEDGLEEDLVFEEGKHNDPEYQQQPGKKIKRWSVEKMKLERLQSIELATEKQKLEKESAQLHADIMHFEIVRSEFETEKFRFEEEHAKHKRQFLANKDEFEAEKRKGNDEYLRKEKALEADQIRLKCKLDKLEKIESEELNAEIIREEALADKDQLEKDRNLLTKEKDNFEKEKDQLEKDKNVYEAYKKDFEKQKQSFSKEKLELDKEKVHIEAERIDLEEKKLEFKKCNNKQKKRSLATSTGNLLQQKRHAFTVANTYENTKLMTLTGTLQSADLVKEAIEKHGFLTSVHTNIDFDMMKRQLVLWKERALKDGDTDALLFYFCGHGGKRRQRLLN